MALGKKICGFISCHLLGGEPSRLCDSHGPFAKWFVTRDLGKNSGTAVQSLTTSLEEAGGFTPEGAVVRALSTREAVLGWEDMTSRYVGYDAGTPERAEMDGFAAQLRELDKQAKGLVDRVIGAHGSAILASPNFELMKQRFHPFREDLLNAFNRPAAKGNEPQPAAAAPPSPPRASPPKL